MAVKSGKKQGITNIHIPTTAFAQHTHYSFLVAHDSLQVIIRNIQFKSTKTPHQITHSTQEILAVHIPLKALAKKKALQHFLNNSKYHTPSPQEPTPLSASDKGEGKGLGWHQEGSLKWRTASR